MSYCGRGGKMSFKVKPARISYRRRKTNAMLRGTKLAANKVKPHPIRCAWSCILSENVRLSDGAIGCIGGPAILMFISRARRRSANDIMNESSQELKPTRDRAMEKPTGWFLNTIGHRNRAMRT
jgi:hypothetical protein